MSAPDLPPSPVARLTRALDRLELASFRRRTVLSRELGVRADELLVLRLLAERGQATQDDLAAFAGLSRSGAGAMIARLERNGLVERSADRLDRRTRPVRLTERARAGLLRADAALRDRIARLAQELDHEHAERFLLAVAEVAEEQAGVLPEANGPETPVPPRQWTRWG